MRTFSRADSKATVQVGETFHLALEATSTAGYEWSFQPVKGLEVSQPRLEATPKASRVGAGAVQVFTIQARRPGSYKLHLTYKRSWEQAVEDSAEFSIVAREK